MSDKKLRRNNGSVTEKAHLNTDLKKYDENFDKIFKEKIKKSKESDKKNDDGLDMKYYYRNKMFPSDLTVIKKINGDKLEHQTMHSSMKLVTNIKTFLHYWKKTSMKVK